MPSIEEQIRKAMEEGKFNNLPGKGKPLRLEENPLEDPDWRIAYHVLRSGGFTLPWIETRQEIERGLAVARQGLKRSWDWREKALSAGGLTPSIEAEWRRARELFAAQIAAINKQIFSYNLETPASRFQMRALNPEREEQEVCGKD
jgi:DnaJ family protein C protein 28